MGPLEVGSEFVRFSSPQRERRVCLLNGPCVGVLTGSLTVAARGQWAVGSGQWAVGRERQQARRSWRNDGPGFQREIVRPAYAQNQSPEFEGTPDKSS